MNKYVRSAVLRTLEAERPYAQSMPLAIEQLSITQPRRGEVGVTIERASLCHSDLSVVNGDRVRPLPMALGHEAVGTVSEVGEGVDDLEVGDRVVLVFVPSCGHCAQCRAHRPALCSRAAAANAEGGLITGDPVLRDASGRVVRHHLGVSAFSSEVVVARQSLVRIDDDVPLEIAALFGCAVLTGMGAVIRSAAVQAGQTVVVFGLGAVGLSSVMAAAALTDVSVVAIDPNTAKHPVAVAAGADRVGTPEQAGTLIAGLTDEGAHVAIEAVGQAPVMEQCLGLVARGGAVVSVGLPHPDQTLTTNALQFAGQGKRLIGSYMGDAVPQTDIPRYVQMWREGRLPIELLHSDTVPLDHINEALDALANGDVIRRLFVP